jgi:hypothetical protein
MFYNRLRLISKPIAILPVNYYATSMRDIVAYAALILSMSQRDYHIFRISNARTYQPG